MKTGLFKILALLLFLGTVASMSISAQEEAAGDDPKAEEPSGGCCG